MSQDLWGDEDFNDVPDEVQLDSNGRPIESAPVNVRTPRPTVQARPKPIPEPIEEEVENYEEILEEVEEDYTDVFNDANLRIEQGRLYQLIMNHPLFDGMDADPRAIANVEREIKKFARESMEVMLGMRQTIHSAQPDPRAPLVSSPFNQLEVDILKKIASKATNGATQADNADEVAEQMFPKPEKPPEPPKRQTLNTIGNSRKVAPQIAPTQTKKVPVRPQQSFNQPSKQNLPKKPSAPLKRTKMDGIIDRIAEEEGVPRELLEEDLLTKPINQLTDMELIERNKIVSKRRTASVKSTSAIPMASPAQAEMLAQQQVDSAMRSPNMSTIFNVIAKANAKT